MSRHTLHSLLALMLLAFAAGSPLGAQPSGSLPWLTLRRVCLEEPWLRSGNPAGLGMLAVRSVWNVELYADKRNGGFTGYSGSGNSFGVGAVAESFYRLNDRTVVYGKVDYLHRKGLHMGGSCFIDPYNAPFDLVEAADSTAGTKVLEQYSLAGAVAVSLSPRWTIGARMDYTAASYAKQKDLRHVNSLMDMSLSAALLWKPLPWLEAGMSYSYRRRTEGLLMDMYGTTDRVYHTLVDYGAFFGRLEQFGENGYTKENEEKPLFDRYHGGSVQLKWHVLPRRLSLFAEAGYRRRAGYYGKKSPSTIVYSVHGGSQWHASAVLLLRRKADGHRLQARWERGSLANDENIYREENVGGGLSNVNYYGTLHTSDRYTRRASLSYTGSFGLSQGMPRWMLEAGLFRHTRQLTASVYPFYRHQDISLTGAGAGGQYNLLRKRDLFSFGVDAAYARGKGAPCADGTYTAPSSSQSPPDGLPAALAREHGFLTCPRIRAGLTLGYARRMPHGNLRGYTRLHYGLLKAWEAGMMPGDMRHSLVWAVGCSF